jgi:hypothetical protein
VHNTSHIQIDGLHKLTIILIDQLKHFKHQFIYTKKDIKAIGYSQTIGSKIREFSAGETQLLDQDFQYKFDAMDIKRVIVATSDDEIIVMPVHTTLDNDFIQICQAKMLASLINGEIPKLTDLYQ